MTSARPVQKLKRRQRAHGVLPVGFVWRDGRPRWLPSPTRRAQGWRPVDLAIVSARGEKQWMTQGQAVDRSKAINAAVVAWTLRGEVVPPDMVEFAPPGAVDASRPSPGEAKARRSIGALADAWLASPDFTLPREKGGLAESTKGDYRRKLSRLFEAIVQSEAQAKVDALRALPIETLAAPEEEDETFPLEDAYHWLIDNAGHPMAHGVLQVASAWITWLWKKKRIRAMAANPVELIDRSPPTGRIRIGRVEEIRALVDAADAMPDHAFIADALLLALDLGWSLADVLRLDWRRLVRRPDGQGGQRWTITRNTRAKTGVAGSEIALTAIGATRVERIIARNAEGVTPNWVVSRDPAATRAINPRLFNTYWNAVRDRAAEQIPSLKAGDGVEGSEFDGPFNFMDTRDTFITLAREAELTVEQTCSRSQHQPTRVHAVWQKHYGAITPLIAAEGARKMGAHFDAGGWVKALA